MKFRMLSVVSIILVLTIKSMDISAKDYHKLRVFAHAIPEDSFVPSIVPYMMETKLDSVIYQLASASAITELYVALSDSIVPERVAFEELKMIATEEELNNLLLHESPVVKVYAHRALLENDMNMNCDFELALLEDSTCVDWVEDDFLMSSTVMEMVTLPYFD